MVYSVCFCMSNKTYPTPRPFHTTRFIPTGTSESDPQLCGSKQCPYANMCVASLAGYSSDQCESPPEECPVSTEDCSGDPSNPVKCGAAKQCPFATLCEARSAGYNLDTECCQDVRGQASACPSIFAPVSCGPPQKQCPYSTQCEAGRYHNVKMWIVCIYFLILVDSYNFFPMLSLDAAGYNSNQCCDAVPEGVACPSIQAPVQCGAIPCKYSSQCEADAAGYSESDCCALPGEGVVCAAMLAPVTCGPAQCEYSNQCVASAAGYAEEDCCGAPPEDTICTADLNPVQCGVNQCQYDNQCLATAAGHSEDDCCPQGNGACTQENDPVKCNDKCTYGSQSCADLAGFSQEQCCKQPKELAACPANFAPVACSQANCVYDNDCIAELAGFDPNSCVKLSSSTPGGTSAGPAVLNSGADEGESAACVRSVGPFGKLLEMMV